jgi:hypothetical protein
MQSNPSYTAMYEVTPNLTQGITGQQDFREKIANQLSQAVQQHNGETLSGNCSPLWSAQGRVIVMAELPDSFAAQQVLNAFVNQAGNTIQNVQCQQVFPQNTWTRLTSGARSGQPAGGRSN